MKKDKECIALKNTLERNIKDLDNREKEIEIKRLRVEKIIKDNNLQKDLDNLKKELGN